ncbi:DUF1934 domain-containing protein [Orenia marismortui]|uniref:DUF1934 domain-containing protein n=1 Tax=Orenia marismortui TaxID=46469 RepID=UPI00037DD98C|nr:DUF1934 domain-containing protein [Orenia marismortui]
MPKEVKLRINSIQDDGNQSNKISFKTKGSLYNKNNTYYLKYKEELEGVKGVKTTLKIKPDRLTLIRQGKLRMIQEFVLDEKREFDYHTPYGTLNFEVEVQNLKFDLGSSQGKISLSYQLYNDLKIISSNELNIFYKEE